MYSVNSSATFTITTAYSTADSSGSWTTANATSNTAHWLPSSYGNTNYSAIGNSLFGYNAGRVLQTGANYNTLMGYSAGSGITTGTNNVLLGYNAGTNLTTGSNNVLIGQGVTAASATGSNQLQIGAGISGDLSAGTLAVKASSATAFQVQNASSQGILTVDTSGGQVLLGTLGSSGVNGTLVFNSATAGNYAVTLETTGSQVASYTLKLPTATPATGKCLQTSAGDATQLTFDSCGTGGSGLAKNAKDTSSADATTTYLYGFTNSGSASTGGVLSLDNGTNTGNGLYVTASGNPVAGKALIFASDTNASPSGNLIDLQSGSSPTSKFSVNTSGNVTAGTYNTTTLSGSALTFGTAGTATIQSATSQALNITAHAASTWSTDSGALTLTSAAAATWSTAAGLLTLQGAGGITLTASGSNALTLDTGSSGTISIGGTNATTTIGRSGVALTLNGSNFSVTSGGNVTASWHYNTIHLQAQP